jgi:hypothetical protein
LFVIAGRSARPQSQQVKLVETADFRGVDIVKNSDWVYTSAPGSREADFTWTDSDSKPGVSDDDVRGQHDDGEIVWVSPLSIERPRGAGGRRFASRVERGGFTAIAAETERDFRFSTRRRRHRLKTRQRRGR